MCCGMREEKIEADRKHIAERKKQYYQEKKRYAKSIKTITLVIEQYFGDIDNFHSRNNKECVSE